MNSCDLNQMKQALIAGSEEVIKNEEYLSLLDGYIGDGDHGATAARGFQGVIETLSTSSILSMDKLFLTTGAALSKHMGGAIGPIFGGIFTGAAPAFTGSHCTLPDFAAGMEKALQYVKKIGGAKEGDHTLLDALSPYSASLIKSAESGSSFPTALKLASQAAEEGTQSTVTMKAAKGRAKFLGEKSIGYRDAGASSFTIFAAGLTLVIK